MTRINETVNDRGAETMHNEHSFMEQTQQVQLWPCSPTEEISSWPSVVPVVLIFQGWHDLSSL